jgi:hypothetical protein
MVIMNSPAGPEIFHVANICFSPVKDKDYHFITTFLPQKLFPSLTTGMAWSDDPVFLLYSSKIFLIALSVSQNNCKAGADNFLP